MVDKVLLFNYNFDGNRIDNFNLMRTERGKKGKSLVFHKWLEISHISFDNECVITNMRRSFDKNVLSKLDIVANDSMGSFYIWKKNDKLFMCSALVVFSCDDEKKNRQKQHKIINSH